MHRASSAAEGRGGRAMHGDLKEASMNRRRFYFFTLTFAALLCVPALAQTSIPNFSGTIWAHPMIPGFETPPTGPGPVRNLSRSPNGVSNFNQLVGDYKNPILKPEAAAIVKKFGDMSLAGVGYETPSNQCWPGGLPYMLWNIEMQMFQRKDEVTILYLLDHHVRHIRMNQSHPANVKPSIFGDSVGHYEGDTLVIDTIGIKKDPFAMLDMYGTPYSDKLHVVERYRLIDYAATNEATDRDEKDNLRLRDYLNDPGIAVDNEYRGPGLQLTFTVEDDTYFTTPWSANITYRKAANEWRENVCAENLNEYYYNKNVEVPTATKPDF
jgi:hypothetical protein